MKTKFFIMLFAFSIIATSCDSKDSPTETTSESIESSISISGATEVSFHAETNAMLSNSSELLITIGTTEGTNRSMTIESNEGINSTTGTFSVPSEYSVWFVDDSQSGRAFAMNSGSVKISQLGSGSIAGSFDLQGSDIFDSTYVINISGNFTGILIEL
jgi:hypothetical protein